MTRARLAAYLAVLCASYALALLITLPASWVAYGIERATKGMLELRAPEGSAWSGSGRLYARRRSGELLDLGTLRWRTSSAALASGALAADVSLGERSRLHAEVSPSALVLRDLALELPAAVVAGVVPGGDTLGPRGTVSVRSDSLRFERDALLGLADVEWRDVSLARVKGIELGSHVAKLRGAGSKVDIELGTLAGPVRLSGKGGWTPQGGLAVSGSAQATGSEPALVPLMKGLCTEYRDDRCLFQIRQ